MEVPPAHSDAESMLAWTAQMNPSTENARAEKRNKFRSEAALTVRGIIPVEITSGETRNECTPCAMDAAVQKRNKFRSTIYSEAPDVEKR